MTIKTLSFLRNTTGKTEEVMTALQAIPQIKKIYYVTGVYDLALIIETSTSAELHDILLTQIGKITGIMEMNSVLIIKTWTGDQDRH